MTAGAEPNPESDGQSGVDPAPKAAALRVLVVNIPLPGNRFLHDLNNALESYVALEHSSDRFWSMEGDYEIVHLHFPEYMTFGHQDAYRYGLSEDLIHETELRLKHWAARARLVVTRHVLLPHDALQDSVWERMYETVYKYSDAVVHFAHASLLEFRARYGKTEFARGREPEHAVIAHQNYAALPNCITQSEARARLGISDEAHVMLVFGSIRSEAERQLVLDTFGRLRTRAKVLLVGSWRENLVNVRWVRLKYWIRDLQRFYYRIHPRYCFSYGFVAEADTQIYLNAADVLFIPRFAVLNSGNVTLGMTFGKVVVGPDSWDVGELLRATGNPVFDPEKPESAAAAVAQGLQLAAEGSVGARNGERARDEWTADACAGQYVSLFARLVANRGPRRGADLARPASTGSGI